MMLQFFSVTESKWCFIIIGIIIGICLEIYISLLIHFWYMAKDEAINIMKNFDWKQKKKKNRYLKQTDIYKTINIIKLFFAITKTIDNNIYYKKICIEKNENVIIKNPVKKKQAIIAIIKIKKDC